MSAGAQITLFEEIAGEPWPRPSESLVSVAVSLFNYQQFLDETLASVAAQSQSRLELIVVDDCSTDGSERAALQWLQNNPGRFERSVLIRHLQNQGLSAARNTAFAAAHADYVFVLDADNLLYPRAIARLLESIEDCGADVAYSQLERFGDACGLGYADVWSGDIFKYGNYVDAMALVSKAAWAKVGGYLPMEFGWEDFEFWCRFIEHGMKGTYVPEILCRYRVHGTSMLRTKLEKNRLRVVHEMLRLHPWLNLDAWIALG